MIDSDEIEAWAKYEKWGVYVALGILAVCVACMCVGIWVIV